MTALAVTHPQSRPESPRLVAAVVVAVIVVGGLLFLLLGGLGDYGARYTFACTIGAAVGVGELVSRYRDHPLKALATFAALGYVLINAAASAGALAAILTFGWTFGLDPATDHAALVATQILVAGFGAMALFRSSLFTVRAGDQDVGIGPSSLLSIILVACDRGVDRNRARDRAEVVGGIMRDVSFEAANGPLPTVALALMQNLDAPDQAALSVEVERLRNDDTGMSDQAKSLLLGLAISNAIGPDVLVRAKEALGDEIIRAGKQDDLLTEAVQRLVDEQVGGPPAADDTTATVPPVVTETSPASDTTSNGTPPPTSAQPRPGEGGLPQTPQTPERAD